MPEEIPLRFAVGTFETWAQLREALRDGRLRGLVMHSLNCLALERTFAGTHILAPDGERVAVHPLPFPGNVELIACTSGVLADRLVQRLRAGASSLGDALCHWLIPRHAAGFEDAVRGGKILFWMQVVDSDDERRAYQCLLTHSLGSVGVHDLFVPGEK
ncbi:MAG TPA: hypothetical protein VH913_20620 [Hyphomicrobiaceae bacterium]